MSLRVRLKLVKPTSIFRRVWYTEYCDQFGHYLRHFTEMFKTKEPSCVYIKSIRKYDRFVKRNKGEGHIQEWQWHRS